MLALHGAKIVSAFRSNNIDNIRFFPIGVELAMLRAMNESYLGPNHLDERFFALLAYHIAS